MQPKGLASLEKTLKSLLQRHSSKVSVLHIRWQKYWSFSFSISPSNEYSGLIPFRMDWLDLLAATGRSGVFSNTIVQKRQFFGAQLFSQSDSHPYMTTGKIIALIRQTFVGNVSAFEYAISVAHNFPPKE